MNCPKCKSPLLWSEDRGVNCDGCEYDPTEEELIWIEQLAACKKELSEEQLKCHAAEERAEQAEAKVERLEGECELLHEQNKALDLSCKHCSSCGLLLPNHAEGCGRYPLVVDELQSQLHQAIAQRDEAQRLYTEIIYQVGNKFPGESRHETAVRYTKERESHANQADTAAGTGEGK